MDTPFPTRFPREDLLRRARRLERLLVDPFFPPRCRSCDARAAGAWWPHLCPRCAEALPLFERWMALPSGLELYASWVHAGAARRLLHALKYEGATRVGRRIGRELARGCGLARAARPSTLLVGVPVHWSRRWRRGHDQVAALIAGVRSEVPWLRTAAALRRVRRTRSQVGLDRAGRTANVAGAFEVGAGRELRGRRVLLLDDVVTTGATLCSAAAAVRRAGGTVEAALAAAVAERTARKRPAPPRG